MSTAMVNPELRKKIKVRMRPDLTITKQNYSGQRYYIVKDPVGLKYYRFREEELFLLKQFDGKNNLDDVRHAFVERFRPQRISVSELEKFVQQLLQTGIATADTPQIGQRLYERYKQRRWEQFKQILMNILYIKVPIFDPERLLSAMMPYTKFLFTIPFFILAMAFGLSSILLVLVNWQTFITKLPSYHEFFTWKNIFYFWGTLAIVKICHEFGHGLSCKRFGGEVHEMGLLFLVMTPCLYCNVTDSWMIPNKWHRAIIGAAGIYVELIISSIFVWVWWYSNPGMLNTLSLSIIFICSVSTVVFNGNPLLRYDGYYIMSDLLEIPNLRDRSNRFLGNTFGRVFFGTEVVHDPYEPRKGRAFFAIYAIAAYLYRWLVTIGILWFIYSFLKPYKLGSISALLAVGAAASMFVMPIRKVIKTLQNRWRSLKVNMTRLVLTGAVALALIAALLLVPLPMRIDAPFVLQPADATTVFVQMPGVLTNVYVRDGDHVTSGTLLGRMLDPEVEKEYARLQLQFEQADKSRRIYIAMNDRALAGQAQTEAQYTLQVMRNFQEQMNKLNVTVPADVSGTVFSPPKPEKLGTVMKSGEPFCLIGDPTKLEAYIVVPHADRPLVEVGRPVWLKLSGHVGDIREGEVEQIATTEIFELPPALSNKHGGEVQSTSDPDRKIERPMFKSFAVQVPVSNEDLSLVAGTRGVARLSVGYRSLYWRAKRYLQQTFHFRM